MTRMTSTQRTAILKAFENRNDDKVSVWSYARRATVQVLKREGWIAADAMPTRVGMIAAGVDMDAIHAEASEANSAFDRLNAKFETAMNEVRSAVPYFAEHPMAADELRALDPRRMMSAAVLRSTGVLDNLHAEALDEMPASEPVWDTAGGQRATAGMDREPAFTEPITPAATLGFGEELATRTGGRELEATLISGDPTPRKRRPSVARTGVSHVQAGIVDEVAALRRSAASAFGAGSSWVVALDRIAARAPRMAPVVDRDGDTWWQHECGTVTYSRTDDPPQNCQWHYCADGAGQWSQLHAAR